MCMCLVCVCFSVCKRAGALVVEKTVVYTVCAYVSDMYCEYVVFVLATQHANGAVFACGVWSCVHEWTCLNWVRVAMQAHTRSYITDLALMHCRAAAHIHEFAFFRDTETRSFSEGLLVCSRTNQTVLQYEASSLYLCTFADGVCWLSLNWNVNN